MDLDDLQRRLIDAAQLAELHGLVRLPPGWEGADRQRRAEMAAWITTMLLARATAGDRAAVDFWRHRDRPPQLPPAPGDLPAVGLFSPRLGLGGAERWIVDLGRHLDRDRVWVAGLAIETPPVDPGLLALAVEAMPVYVGRHACPMLAQQCDALVYWGTGELPADAPPTAVYVSHGLGACAKRWAPLAAAQRVHLAAVSEAAAASFGTGHGRPVDVLYNGVDPARVRCHQTRDKIRRRWGLAEGEIAVGYVGRISQEKNPGAAARAVAELGPPHRAVYKAPSANQPFRAAIAGEGKNPPAVFLPPGEPIGAVLRGLDVLILASHTEGMALTLLEAWLAGLPTVATPVGAIPELEAKWGPLTVRVPIDPQPADLAAAVRLALAEDNRPTVQRAQAVTRDHFTAAAMGRRWSDYLLRLYAADRAAK